MAERTMRVLMTADAVGGVWQYATELAAGLTHYGIEVVLAVLGPAPDGARRQAANAIRGLTLSETGLALDWLSDAESTRDAAARVAALARQEKVDLVHLNSPALAAEQSFSMPVVGVVHGCLATWWQAARPARELDPAFQWHEAMTARALRVCDRVLAPSASYAEVVRARYRLAALPHVVHNGRTLPPAISSSPPQDYGLTAGRLWDEVKNVHTLDRAAALLRFPFHAAGPATAPHGAMVRTEHLQLLGRLDAAALERRLANRPVFVSAATFEPFGLAVLEAAAWGCPLVLSDIPTFRELWEEAAIFVPAEDAAGFAAAISDCIADPQRRTALGEAARHRAQRYTAQRMAQQTAAHYRMLVPARLAA
ncbi:MAG: glycosyltransferase family 4 protein [Novosphingobium sp.]